VIYIYMLMFLLKEKHKQECRVLAKHTWKSGVVGGGGGGRLFLLFAGIYLLKMTVPHKPFLCSELVYVVVV
jgi:hypothetical protein